MSWISFPHPLIWATLALVCAWAAGRYLLAGSPRWWFAARVTVFVCLTLLLRAENVIPFEVMTARAGDRVRRVEVAILEIAWWLAAAILVRLVVRAFLRLGNPRREVTLAQEILGGLVYLIAVIAISTYVFNLPIQGLLATSGALAIVVGLALQSSLGDAFSGIALNLERPYRIGDWIVVDGTVEGGVLETNWRTTHIRTSSNDLAIIPNSVIAKSRIVNCSQPTTLHNSSVCVRLDRSLAIEEAQDLLKDVLLGCANLVRVREPSVTIKDVTAESISYELEVVVADVRSVNLARAEILRRAFYATSIAGGGFAAHLAAPGRRQMCRARVKRQRRLAALPLFDGLTGAEHSALSNRMVCRLHPAGCVIATRGTVMRALVIVRRGVLVAWEEDGDRRIEGARFTPGLYFGEIGLLTGAPLGGNITALTQAVTYEISKDALAPILSARPAVADQLGETLELREQMRKSLLSHGNGPLVATSTVVGRVAETIRHLFVSG